MRLSLIRACVTTASAAFALAACNGHGVVPSSTSYAPPASFNDAASPFSSTSCATSPPQYDWIFKGSCDTFTLKPTGGTFSLAEYENLTITGSIGKNTVKGSAKVAIADAIDKDGDILKYNGKSFPPYKANGTTVAYASASNQSSQTIKPISVPKKPVLQYVITDKKGFPGNTCGAAVLGQPKPGQYEWEAFPGTFTVKDDKVTISVYEAPKGFALPPKGTPLYFAVNCYKS